MKLKPLLRQIHLYLGLISGLVVFIVSVTGCIYSFEEEIRNFVYKDLLFVKKVKSQRIPLNKLIDAARNVYPGEGVKNIRIKANGSSSVTVLLKNRVAVYLDPYTGLVLGSIDQEKDFFAVVLKIHRSLYLGDVGKKITGVSAVIFVGMLISGIVLWWPSKKQRLKHKLQVKFAARRKRFIFDLHSVLGFYASWIILFTALTGLVWAFDWAEHSLYWLTGSKKEKKQTVQSVYTAGAVSYPINLILEKANAMYPQTKEYFISMPDEPSGAIRVFMRYGKQGLFRVNNQLFFDQYTGNVIKELSYSKSSAGDKFKATNYDIHTGKIADFPGQLLVFFASLVTASLPVTGFLMWRAKKKI